MTDIAAILGDGSAVAHRACVLAAGLLAGWLIARDSRAWPLPPLIRVNLLIVTALGGMIGAALPGLVAGGAVGGSVQALAESRADGLLSVGAVALMGPKTVMGGLLGGFLAIALFKRVTRVGLDTSDAFARGACVLMAVGRLGCVFQHCCFGCAVQAPLPPWYGVQQGDGVLRHPVQLIELAAQGALLIVVLVLHRSDLLAHRRLFLVFLAYGLARFALEFLREPLGATWLGLDVWQYLALVMAAIGGWQLIRRRGWTTEVPGQRTPA
jgi:phosphatidylglycerol:prolipoprotein diacylglycerol transferase